MLWEGAIEGFYLCQCGVAVRILGCGRTSPASFPRVPLGILPCTSVPESPSGVEANHGPGAP